MSFRGLLRLVRYRIDRAFARGPAARFALLALMSVLVVAFGTLSIFFGLFSEENEHIEGIARVYGGGFVDAIWWSGKHIFDPTFFDYSYGATVPIVIFSLLVTLMGVVIFGSLVGFVSSAVEERLDALRKGNGPVVESNHILVLGFSPDVGAIISLLHSIDARLRFVVLAEHDVESMQEALRVALSSRALRAVALRSGAPSVVSELKRVCFESARSIIVVADEVATPQAENADIGVIKALMLLSAHRFPGPPPKMVGEVTRQDSRHVATIASNRAIPLVFTGDIISKILVQCSRQPGLSLVYQSIFGLGDNTLQIMSFPSLAGRRFDSILPCFETAVPIGISRAVTAQGRTSFVPLLNPPGDHVVAHDEWLVLLARNRDVVCNPDAAPYPKITYAPPPPTKPKLERLLILGWNDHLYRVLTEFDAHVASGARITIAAHHDEASATALLEEHLPVPLRRAAVSYVKANYLKDDQLKALLDDTHDSVLVLADHSAPDADTESRLMMTLLLLRELRRTHPPAAATRVVSEIASLSNRDLLVDSRTPDIVCGSQLVSMILSQVALQQMLQTVYDQLLGAQHEEFHLKPANLYVPPGAAATFRNIAAAACQRNEVAIGVLTKTGRRGGDLRVELNPPRDRALDLGPDDSVIVVYADVVEAGGAVP